MSNNNTKILDNLLKNYDLENVNIIRAELQRIDVENPIIEKYINYIYEFLESGQFSEYDCFVEEYQNTLDNMFELIIFGLKYVCENGI